MLMGKPGTMYDIAGNPMRYEIKKNSSSASSSREQELKEKVMRDAEKKQAHTASASSSSAAKVQQHLTLLAAAGAESKSVGQHLQAREQKIKYDVRAQIEQVQMQTANFVQGKSNPPARAGLDGRPGGQPSMDQPVPGNNALASASQAPGPVQNPRDVVSNGFMSGKTPFLVAGSSVRNGGVQVDGVRDQVVNFKQYHQQGPHGKRG